MSEKKKYTYIRRHEFCADFETTTGDFSQNESQVWLYYIREVWDNVNDELGLNIKDFFGYVDKITLPSNIWFHNINWDGEFILNWLCDNRGFVKQEVGKFNTKLDIGEWTNMSDGVSSHYVIKYKNLLGKAITFKCSYKQLQTSVSDLQGVKKTEIDYHIKELYNSISEVPHDTIVYIKNDVNVVRKYMEDLLTTYTSKQLGITSSGTAMKMVKENLTKDLYDSYFTNKIKAGKITKNGTYTDGEWDYFKLGYVGGYTNLIDGFKNKLLKNVRTLDVNSLYPFILRNYTLPIGEPIYSCKRKKCNHLRFLEINMDFNMKERGVGFIPSKTGYTNNIEWLREGKNHVAYVTGEMWELIQKHYNITYFKIIKETHFNSAKDLFSEYIDHFQKMKQNAEKGTFEYLFSKLMQNQVYGKFGMSPLRKKYFFRPFDPLKDTRIDKVIYGAKKPMVMDYDWDLSNPAYIPMALWITSLAKIITIELANYVNKLCNHNYEEGSFIYSDTDSVHISVCDSCWEIIKQNIDIHPKRLGAWDLEKESTYAIFFKRKFYLEFDNPDEKISTKNLGSAGLDKNHFTNYTYREVIERDPKIKMVKKSKKKLIGGIILEEKEIRIKELENVSKIESW